MLKIFLVLSVSTSVFGASYVKLSDISSTGKCDKFDICNVVHRPYWSKNNVEKLCICPEGTFCPATFSQADQFSLLINSRTQMKFCSPVSTLFAELTPCNESMPALEIKSTFNSTVLSNVSAKLLCACETKPVYWQYHSRSQKIFHKDDSRAYDIYDRYTCNELKKCETNEFCGFARSDYGFIFQRCTCASFDDCRYHVEESDIEDNIEELFYNELLYKAHCLRNSTFDDY